MATDVGQIVRAVLDATANGKAGGKSPLSGSSEARRSKAGARSGGSPNGRSKRGR